MGARSDTAQHGAGSYRTGKAPEPAQGPRGRRRGPWFACVTATASRSRPTRDREVLGELAYLGGDPVQRFAVILAGRLHRLVDPRGDTRHVLGRHATRRDRGGPDPDARGRPRLTRVERHGVEVDLEA